MTMTVDNVLYTGQARTTSGWNGASRSSDGRLDIKLSSPSAPAPLYQESGNEVG